MPHPLPPRLIAHRGASKEAPENTLAAFNRALSLGVDWIEIDVRLSKDKVPIVLHDDSAERMSGTKHATPIDQLTLAEIKQIDVGHLFDKTFTEEKIPTLSEVLSLNWNQTNLMIEIKECPQDPKTLVDAVFREVTKIKTPLPSIVFGSFSLDILKEVQQHLSQTKMPFQMIGIIEEPQMIDLFLNYGLKRLALWYKLLHPELIQNLKSKDIDVWTFTVDDLNIAQFLISLGVNGIISNVPKMMMESQVFRLH